MNTFFLDCRCQVVRCNGANFSGFLPKIGLIFGQLVPYLIYIYNIYKPSTVNV